MAKQPTRQAASNRGNGDRSKSISPEPRLAPMGKEIQRFGALRLLPIALSAEAATSSRSGSWPSTSSTAR